jgi:hypothetical protein
MVKPQFLFCEPTDKIYHSHPCPIQASEIAIAWIRQPFLKRYMESLLSKTGQKSRV